MTGAAPSVAMVYGATPRVAMISGASRGIGAAVARELAAAGWQVSLGVRDPAPVANRWPDINALVCRYDAEKRGAERTWVTQTVQRFGRIDALVNNAGIMIPKSVVEAGDADVDRILDVNVKAPLALGREAWPYLTASGAGRIVTLASLSGKRVKAARAGLYSVSKFAVLALAHAFRHAGFDHGVRSTAICPGFVATDMARELVDLDPDRMIQPADLARIVRLILELPNSSSVAELPINCQLEDSY
jgi:NAD(P)-dependent dehydrogenase (short-subunit alcohol dehydrogenase family)